MQDGPFEASGMCIASHHPYLSPPPRIAVIAGTPLGTYYISMWCIATTYEVLFMCTCDTD